MTDMPTRAIMQNIDLERQRAEGWLECLARWEAIMQESFPSALGSHKEQLAMEEYPC